MKTSIRVGDSDRKLELLPGIAAVLPTDPHSTSSRTGTQVSRQTIDAANQRAFKQAGIQFRHFQKHVSEPGPAAGRVFLDTRDETICVLSQRMTVKLEPSLSKPGVRKALHRHGLQVLNKLKFSRNTFDVWVPSDLDPVALSQTLANDPEFVYAEPELIERCGQRFVPTDRFAGRQWQHTALGAGHAWDVSRGKNVTIEGRTLVRRPMRIAIIDFGFELDNPDLAPAVRHVGVFRENGNLPADFFHDPAQMPIDSHGTWCGSVALARANNDYPCCGMANEAEFIPVACLSGGIGTQQSLARAIAFAADPTREDSVNFRKSDGADVISCSLYPPAVDRMSSVLRDALEFATAKGRAGRGCPVFYAVANQDQAISRDAMASSEFTIAIGRTNRADRRRPSAFGPGLDMLAPGYDIVISRSSASTRRIRGTSYATPLAAAVGALVISRHRDLTWWEIRDHLRKTCDKVHVSYDNDGFHRKYGFGRINAESALNTAPESV